MSVSFNKSLDTTNTKLCKSVTGGGECPHGDRCRFAHTVEDLCPPKCRFGEKCRNVTWNLGAKTYTAGKYRNCGFIHDCETKENYMDRLSLVIKERPVLRGLSEEEVLKRVAEMLEEGVTEFSVEM